jgi:hypothetical protein
MCSEPASPTGLRVALAATERRRSAAEQAEWRPYRRAGDHTQWSGEHTIDLRMSLQQAPPQHSNARCSRVGWAHGTTRGGASDEHAQHN